MNERILKILPICFWNKFESGESISAFIMENVTLSRSMKYHEESQYLNLYSSQSRDKSNLYTLIICWYFHPWISVSILTCSMLKFIIPNKNCKPTFINVYTVSSRATRVYAQSISNQIRKNEGVGVIAIHDSHLVMQDFKMTFDANRGMRTVENWAYTREDTVCISIIESLITQKDFKIAAWNKHHSLTVLKSFPIIPNT